MLKFLVVLFIILNSYFLILTPVHAQSLTYGWQIDSFSSDINIQTDGKVSVTETLNVDFSTLDKHGIFRDIPYIYTNDDGTKSYTKIEVQSVEKNGKSEKYQTSESNGYLRIKIGDADKTISGKQTYEIDYLTTGVLLSFENYDELYWNVTGNYWDVPIKMATATVTLPQEAIRQVACYQGTYGATVECQGSNTESRATFNSVGPLQPNEGLTLAIGYTKGLVPLLTIEPPVPLYKQLLYPANIAIFAITMFGLWAIIFRIWWKDGRDFWLRKKDLFDPNAKEERRPIGGHETIVVEYSPPENLRPAELGTLIDQRADTRDVTATIIDLAARGYLKIKELSKSWLFGKVDYELTRTIKNTTDLLPYEKELHDALFDGRQSVKTSALKNKFYTDLSKVKDLLYDEVVNKKLFFKRPDKVRTLYFVIAIFALAGGVGTAIFGLASKLAPLVTFGIGATIGIIPLFVLANFMPRRTGHGRELYRRTKGYFLFIDKAEKHRQKFFEDKNLFNEVLPYAITFGLVEKFAQAMKDIGLKPQNPTWYSGVHAFNVTSFGSSVETFSSSVSHSMASTPSSSGSGGGGFSGGGGGGGGGGSW